MTPIPPSTQTKVNSSPIDADDVAPIKPVLIDLDEALIRNGLLAESALAYVVAHPLRGVGLMASVVRGKTDLKRMLASSPGPDPEFLPVNERAIELAQEAKRRGRQVFLVSAGSELFARAMAARFTCFDDVIVMSTNGGAKATLLSERFPGGFDYVSDGAADSPIGKIEALDGSATNVQRKSRLRAMTEAARLHHWVKNTLIFVPAVLSGTIADPFVAAACCVAFVALGLIAVGTYLVNDLLDIDHDRRHWSKRFRPIATGDLPMGMAMAVAAVSIFAGLTIGAAIGLSVLLTLLAYLVLTLTYSMHLKRLPIVDVTALASLFTLRIAVGIAVAGVFASPWLLVFSMALFASLSIAKRYTEIQRVAIKGDTEVPGRGYLAADAALVLGLGLATATTSVVILVLFLIFDAFGRDVYRDPHWLWLFPVIIFLWIGRIWLICQRGELNDDPVVFALKDRQSLILGALAGLAFGLAVFGAPL